ncbi:MULTISPECIES: DUF3768 domain-containing protein [unclassified Sphingopyxis]
MTEQRHSRSGLHRIYYDLDCEYGSEDPADASITTRVVTILLPEDY